MEAVRSSGTSGVTAMLTALTIILAIGAEIAVLQAEETSLASIQVSTTSSTRSSSTPTSETSALQNVTFVVSSECLEQPTGWTISEWGVTLGNVTKTYPPDANLSQIQSGEYPGPPSQSSSITFVVPDGEYTFQLYPKPVSVLAGPPGQQISGQSGVVRVDGGSIEICAAYIAIVG